MNETQRLAAALAGRYRIERELGAGGMATVYLAEDVRHGRRVAIKVLRPDLAAVIGAERFLREIRTIAGLQHPHVLGLIDSGELDGTAFYVMPYVDGESLRDRLVREKQIPIADAVGIATEVASALDYAHRHGVIHRDIKPENILLHDGRALVADFGIALAVSTAGGGTRMTETGMSLGTPHYMAPEQAMGERDITARADVYSLGATTYEMLTGEPPFTGHTAQAIVARVLTEAPRPIAVQRHTVPAHVEHAVLTALEKLPADRFASAADFAAALTRGGGGEQQPVRTARRTAAGPAALRSPRLLRIAGLAAALLLVAAAVALALGGLRGEEGEAPLTARVLFGFAAGQTPRPAPSLQPALSVTPDGSGLLYSGPGATPRTTRLWLRRWDRLAAVPLTQTVTDGCCAAFSPGGDSVAYLSLPAQLWVAPIATGLGRMVLDSGLVPASDFGGGVDWGADGMLYASGTAGLIRIAPEGGAPELLVPIDTTQDHFMYLWPAVLPGSRGALVSVAGFTNAFDPQSTTIGVADFGARTVRMILQGTRARYVESGHIIYSKPTGVLHAVPFDPGALRVTGPEIELPDTIALNFPALGDFAIGGGVLAYNRAVYDSFDVVWVDRTGRAELVSRELTAPSLDGPRLSPDGRELLIGIGGADRLSSLWRKPLEGGEGTRLTFDESLNWRSDWHPGGDRVAFLSNREARRNFRAYELDPRRPGSGTAIPVPEPRMLGGVSWGPDGRWLLVRTDDQTPGSGDIMGWRPGVDTAVVPLVATDAEEVSPAVSPDGRWIAYSSNARGGRDIYVRPFPETGTGIYQVSTGGGVSPAWHPDGRELYYIDPDGRMVAVPVEPGATFRMGRPQVLFDASPYQQNIFTRQYDVARDGRFVMIRGAGGQDVDVVVVFGFEEELRRRSRP